MIFVLFCYILIVNTETLESGCDGVIFTKRIGDFATAQAYCKSLGLNIVRIDNEAHNRWISDIAKRKQIIRYWIDYTRFVLNQFYDSDGNTMKYANWGKGEPNNDGKENCIEKFPEFSDFWNDNKCSFKNGIICSDKNNFGKCRESFGTTCDGVIITNIKGSFGTQQRYCSSMGMKMIRIENEFQNSWIAAIARRKKIDRFWIDGNNKEEEGIWKNSDNDILTYTNWRPEEPNNNGGNEHCIEVDSAFTSFWNDLECYNELKTVCSYTKNCIVPTKLDIPTNILQETVSLRTLSFAWSHPKNTVKHYLTTLVKYPSNKIIRKVTETNVEFTNLDMCTKYCLEIVAVNSNGDKSRSSDQTCSYTLAPTPGNVIINEIGTGSFLNKIVSWKYSESKDCAIYYRVEYGLKYNNFTNIIETNKEHLVIKSLERNTVYKIRVRAETKMKVENNLQYGPYSEIAYFYTGTDQIFHFLELENIFNNFYKIMNFHKYTLTINSSHVKIMKEYNKNTNIICNIGELIHLFVEMRIEKKNFMIPFNISCGMQHPQSIIRNINYKKEKEYSQLSWNITKNGTSNYIIYWMNNENYFYKYVNNEHTLFSWNNVKGSEWQQVCIASMDNTWKTSKFICSQYSLYPGPVLNLKAYSINNMIYVSWDKSKEDIHHGYVVNVTSSSGNCQTNVIKMEYYSVNVKEQCQIHNIIRWIFSKPLVIKDILPGNKYTIRVSSIKGNYSSSPSTVLIKTNIRETVRNLQINANSSHIFIHFGAPRVTSNFFIKYHIKVTLRGRSMCTFKYKVIFDEIITETFQFIRTNMLTTCFQYEVEVLPVRQYRIDKSDTLLDLTETDYYPSLKEGFLYNTTEKSTTLENLKASLLSVNLLKLTWDNYIGDNDCSHFGLLVESVSFLNNSNCKTWIITRSICTTLIKDLEDKTKCKNKEYLEFHNKWIKKTLLLHGSFNIANTYVIKVWDMTNKIKVISTEEVTFNNTSECLKDCYGPNNTDIRTAEVNVKSCQEWGEKLDMNMYSKYNSNICYIDKNSNILLLCYRKGKDHRVKCTQQCRKPSNDEKCADNIQILAYVENITISLPMLVPKNGVKGYILLLYNTEHICQRYILKTCRNCINIPKIRTVIQRFYNSCRKGVVDNDLDHETVFDRLINNHEYILYVIPLLSTAAFGKILNVTTATRLSDSMTPNYIKILNAQNTSLQFTWNSYKNKCNAPHFDHYICTLINMRSNKKMTENHTKEMVTFIKLEKCSRYCFYLSIAEGSDKVRLVDHICTYTLSSNLGMLSVEDIETGPSLSRLISWTHVDGDECPKNYRVELQNLFRNEIIYKTTSETTIFIEGLEKDITYQVRVRMEKYTDSENNINILEYSKPKLFFTGQESGCDGVIFTKRIGDFATAQAYCKSLGLNIIRIDNEAHNRWIFDIATRKEIRRYWIDYNRNTDNVWLDSDGKTMQYANWGKGEPNNSGEENCAELFPGYSDYWNDVNCSFKNGIICSNKNKFGNCRELFGLGLCKINEIEDGSLTERMISWKYSGIEDSIYYRVEYQVKYTKEVLVKISNNTSTTVGNLDKNLIYQVKVRAEKKNKVKDSIKEGDYSETKEFFTGRRNINISNVRSYLDSSRKTIDILWNLEDPSSGTMHSFIARINNNENICLASITFDFQPYKEIRKQVLASQHLMNEWNQLSKCIKISKKNFTIHREVFAGSISSSQILDNYTLSVYGLNVLGIHKLY